MTPRPKAASPTEIGSAPTMPPASAWMTTSGRKPTPLTVWLPVVVGIVHSTTLAETLAPPIAMK